MCCRPQRSVAMSCTRQCIQQLHALPPVGSAERHHSMDFGGGSQPARASGTGGGTLMTSSCSYTSFMQMLMK